MLASRRVRVVGIATEHLRILLATAARMDTIQHK